MHKYIGCVYDDYEACGGLHDAMTDRDGNIRVFNSVGDCVHAANHMPFAVDNLDIWDLDTLKKVGTWRVERIWEKHQLVSYKSVKKED